MKCRARRSNDTIELLIIEALRDVIPILLSLKNNKCYVGFIIESQSFRQHGSDIAIVPIASGYRHKDTQELTFTTDYSSVFAELYEDELASEDDINRFRVAFRLSEISTARLFDLEIYKLFQTAHTHQQ